MSGGDNINNIKAMYNRESKYIQALEFIRKDLRDIQDQPLRFANNQINGLISFISDTLGE